MCILDGKPHDVLASQCAIVNNLSEMVVRHLEKDKMMELHKEENVVGGRDRDKWASQN